MKHVLIKALSLLLALMITVPLFVSCGGREQTEESGEQSGDSRTDADPQLEKIDYDGHELTFLTQEGNEYNTRYITAEPDDDSSLKQAILQRNSAVEGKYNVIINHVKTADIMSEVRTKVNSGLVDFDAVLASCGRLANMAKEGLLSDLKTVNGIDLDKPYWDANASSELLMGDKLYFTNCALNLHSIGFVTVFNKRVLNEYGLTSPYDYIDRGEWTLDTWATMVKSVSKDLDGNGIMNEFDQYGSLCETHNQRMFLYAFGVRASTNNEDGYPEFSLDENKEKLISAYSALKDVFSDLSVCFNMTSSRVDPHGYAHKWDYLRSLFCEDHYLFHYTSDSCLSQFEKMGDDVGVIPFPKYDGQQEKFLTMYQYNCNLFALPEALEDPERTGRLVEDMNYQSYLITEPVWLRSLATRNGILDEQSEKYIKMLRENCVYDISIYYDFGKVRSKLLDADLPAAEFEKKCEDVKYDLLDDVDTAYRNFMGIN